VETMRVKLVPWMDRDHDFWWVVSTAAHDAFQSGIEALGARDNQLGEVPRTDPGGISAT
jgi:hypothetical protein